MLRPSAGRGDSYSQGGSEIELSQAAAMEGMRRSAEVWDHPRSLGSLDGLLNQAGAMACRIFLRFPHYQTGMKGERFRYRKGMGRSERLPAERNLPMDRNVPPVSMVRRPSPYADIPSLYDMYVQASGRESTQERFGLKIFRNNSLEPDAIPWTCRSVLNMSLGRVMAWQLIFGAAFRSACFELWIAKGASRCRKRALAGERPLAWRCATDRSATHADTVP